MLLIEKLRLNYYQNQGHQITKGVTLGLHQHDHLYCCEVFLDVTKTHSRYVQLETTFWETAVSGHMIRWNCQV
jgi:hypothetical protein